MKSNRLSIILGVGVGLTVALLWVLGETGPVAVVPAAITHYVEPSGTDGGDCSDPGSPCQTIQYAVGKAVAGDTIDVAAGAYNESVTIGRSLTLQGTGAGRTIVDGNGSVTHQRVMTVTVGSVVIVTGMTIINGKTPDGYHLTADSAAIDKGVDTDMSTDIDGDARPYGAASDLGADEYVSALHVIKEASSNAVPTGALLTYTLHVTNTGSVDLHATVTDTLPTGIAAGRTSGGIAVLPGEQITWTPAITTPGGIWTERLIVTVALDHTGPLTNVVEVATEEGARGEDSVTVSVSRCIYVPLVLRGYKP